MTNVATPAPQRARITDTTIRHDSDGCAYVDTGEDRAGRGDPYGEGTIRATHYYGADVEHADLIAVDAGAGPGDPMTASDLAEAITALQVLLEDVDPSGTNRVRPVYAPLGSVVATINHRTEWEARRVASVFPLAEVEAQIESGTSQSLDHAQLAAWSRAAAILSEPMQGPVAA